MSGERNICGENGCVEAIHNTLKLQAEYDKCFNDDGPVVMRGNWISTEDELPPPETPVLAFVRGMDIPIVLEMRWETCNPMIESYFNDFLYWDNPHNDGQDYEDRVFAWQPLPEDP